jgi:hypothetical protein
MVFSRCNCITINVWTDHEHINYSVGGIWNMYLCYFQNESYLESGMVRLYLLEDLLIYAICKNIFVKTVEAFYDKIIGF